ncbi:nicotinamide N-methyltransferase-like [Ascaphus truei]|uniref:nicotinamide N-methyltransferase-like n=1 Tax=Ascaphus truei TaxID=8439 RepID=UPI003F59BCBB
MAGSDSEPLPGTEDAPSDSGPGDDASPREAYSQVGPAAIVHVVLEGIYASASLDKGSKVTIIYRKFYDQHLKHCPLRTVEHMKIYPEDTGEKAVSARQPIGRVRGDTMIDISAGPNIYQLLSASDIFKEIIVLETTEQNIQEFEKLLKKDPGAADWSYAAKALCELEGNREEWQVKEDKVRRAVKQVVKWDVSKDNPLDPAVLPQVDCVLSLWCLNHISRDKEAYRSNLRKLTSLLKIGGHLLLFGGLNMTYYTIGQHRFFILPYDEKFIREALRDAGYVIENIDVHPAERAVIW